MSDLRGHLRLSKAMRTHSTPMRGTGLKRIALLLAYPALGQLPRSEWDEALKRARDTDFDTIEWIGLLAGVAFVTYMLRFDADHAAALSLPVRYFVQFLVAAPLLILVVGPFYLRRTRRDLERQIEHRRGTVLSDPQK